jgi:hypothetical protein
MKLGLLFVLCCLLAFPAPAQVASPRAIDIPTWFGDPVPLVTPQGRKTRADEWARALNIVYTPSIVLFAPSGGEVIRIEAYLRPFHLAGAFAYVSSGAYRSEPSFQRFLQARAERLRREGRPVDLWN